MFRFDNLSRSAFFAILATLFLAQNANAQPKATVKVVVAKQPAVAELPAPGPYSTTTGQVKIGGKTIAYTATAGRMPLKDEDGKTKASMFFVAYTVAGDRAKRPVTFCFNGGPGSSSVWLHLGMVGPKRIPMHDDASVPKPPYKLIANTFSMLDKSDLVFIDPVSTGYSRPEKGENKSQFHGYDEDITSVGQFIHQYVTEYRRWSSPKFLLGESYGTTRAAGLSGHLQDRYKMYLNGIVMISSVIDFQTIRFSGKNELPYVLFLPTYTATAWYHKRLAPDLQKDLGKTLKAVEKFALGEYTTALMKGDALTAAERKSVVGKLAKYTGLSEEYVEQTNLRIQIFRFTKELLRDQRRTAGRLDSRFKGIDRDAAGDSFEYDPSHSAIDGPFGGTMNDYVRSVLKFESPLPYEILTGRVQPWNYKKFTNRYVDASETLREAMTKNPHLKVFVANGYYDLATPYFASVYSYNHLGLDPKLKKNITMSYFMSGHMMYIHEPSLKKLKTDLDRFYDGTLKAK